MSKRHKYGVAKVEDRTFGGIIFHSKKEMLDYQKFALLLNAGKIAKLELQVPFMLMAATPSVMETGTAWFPEKIGKYIADFVVTELDGTRRIYDSKGVRTPLFRWKMKMFTANYPQLRIVEI